MVSERIGGILLALLAPAMSAALDAEDRGTMQSEMGQITLALAAYRAEHGRYPDRLERLAPKHLDKVPEDIFADGPLHYRQQDNGYMLYSVGRDGEDDGGREYDSGQGRYDVVIRVGDAGPSKETKGR
jgi:type II secretory pathway pseudopilin PulG